MNTKYIVRLPDEERGICPSVIDNLKGRPRRPDGPDPALGPMPIAPAGRPPG